MTLTAEQMEFIQNLAISIIFAVGFIYILRTIINVLKNGCNSIKKFFTKRKRRRKEKQGFQNYKGDTWYPDGTVYNSETGKVERPDYRNK